MTNDEIHALLGELGIQPPAVPTAGNGARWDFVIADAPAYIQTQADVDRMRIVAVIGNPSNRANANLENLMEANFHTALDARYALSEGQLAAVFLHPLEALSKAQLLDGLRQVSLAVRTVGSENASSPLTFGRAGTGNHVDELFEDPKVERESSAPAPEQYKQPGLMRQLLIAVVAAVAAAVAAVLVASLL